jgi:hypothetical protein
MFCLPATAILPIADISRLKISFGASGSFDGWLVRHYLHYREMNRRRRVERSLSTRRRFSNDVGKIRHKFHRFQEGTGASKLVGLNISK